MGMCRGMVSRELLGGLLKRFLVAGNSYHIVLNGLHSILGRR